MIICDQCRKQIRKGVRTLPGDYVEGGEDEHWCQACDVAYAKIFNEEKKRVYGQIQQRTSERFQEWLEGQEA